ncbi:Uma2 family endonuclease [Nostoc sp. CHAB 5836]|uniref:Uma2 family endonuclease n=1 Tax=Nostoc sp. CHAB 5836 TaxID=2780404 RepID=UPI001E323DD2|nr:Uma2 family endonuclease [Nostoc sp. CHAB 5836]MCC5613964.1 Uma2 family endonuclease [Nostoc sp. CHAB 5836]
MSTTKPVERLYTFEEYLTYDDGTEKRYELEDGVLLEMPPASDLHEAIITFLLIRFYLEIQRLGLDWEVRPSGTGVRTSVKKSRLPDLIVMTEEQRQSIQRMFVKSNLLLVLAIRNRGYTGKTHLRGFKTFDFFLVHGGGLCLSSSEFYSPNTFQTSSKRCDRWSKSVHFFKSTSKY